MNSFDLLCRLEEKETSGEGLVYGVLYFTWMMMMERYKARSTFSLLVDQEDLE